MYTSIYSFFVQVRNPSSNLCLDTLGKDEKKVFNVALFSCQGGHSSSEVRVDSIYITGDITGCIITSNFLSLNVLWGNFSSQVIDHRQL